MKFSKAIFSTLIFLCICSSSFTLEIQKNDLRVFAATQNDKFSFGISQNKDDQFTASNEIHIIFPYFYFDFNINAITNRGYKTNLQDPATFSCGRYDELIAKAGLTVNLFDYSDFKIDLTPKAGFCLLGNFGMEWEQNVNHKLSGINDVNLDYERFRRPFAPGLDLTLSLSYKPLYFVNTKLDVNLNNAIFYTTEQSIVLNSTFGTKSLFNVFAGYTLNQTHASSPALEAYKKNTKGFNFGFNLDTGLFKIDYITYPQTRYGYGTLSLDFMNLTKSSWRRIDLNFFMGLSCLINTEFLETQIQSNKIGPVSVYLKNKYVSGFKTNKVNPSAYRYERDYQIITAGVKYEQPLAFIQNWVTPYIELGTGIASFGIQELANQIPESTVNSNNLGTKNFWELEAIAGLDIVPQGLLNFGNAAYSFTVFAGTVIIPQAKKAGAHIKKDTYRTTTWTLHPVEFIYGFAVHMALDF